MSLMANFTSIPNGSNVVEYLFAFDNALKGYAVFSMLIAMIIVVSGIVYLFNQDFIESSLYSVFTFSFVGFIFTLIKSHVFVDVSGKALRLLSFEKFTFFVIILVLLAIYKKVSDV